MIGRLKTIVIDCPEPEKLALFYADLLGGQVDAEDSDWVTIDGAVMPHVAFQRAPDLLPPDWPDPGRPQQFHLDIDVDDVEVAEERALGLGARRLTGQGEDFRVYADPVGHPFCFVWS